VDVALAPEQIVGVEEKPYAEHVLARHQIALPAASLGVPQRGALQTAPLPFEAEVVRAPVRRPEAVVRLVVDVDDAARPDHPAELAHRGQVVRYVV
jgi:hypothetical protein